MEKKHYGASVFAVIMQQIIKMVEAKVDNRIVDK